ncbi:MULTISPECIES: TetR/AcrR family transcriptional regulator [Paenibacillus]|uniref:TetR/AcrR family transcriptional regulator n=1 Tax=Paenibacillus TaxID=44249 RepID=UPI0022B8E348|nr:TetR/AcrR family transcriptional regulator [Paenibacillus caseinilyticus]MCZ8523053.1 TetR/AcrR family transcriptional regulator [Paenibacillus caseinilyticus]
MTAQPPTFKTLPEVKLQQQHLLRRNVIDAACVLLLDEGPEAVTVRRVAQKLNCSTKIIYSLFGSKDALANEMYMEGCRLLADTFQQVPDTEVLLDDLQAIGWAYWQFAQQHSGYYKMMFGGALTDFKPDEQSLEGTATALSRILQMVTRGLERGELEANDHLLIVQMLWSALHGVIHLQFAGHFADAGMAREIYAFTLNQTLSALKRTSRSS